MEDLKTARATGGNQEDFAEYRDALAKRMTSVQLAEAQISARAETD